jgi:hypothetical protein
LGGGCQTCAEKQWHPHGQLGDPSHGCILLRCPILPHLLRGPSPSPPCGPSEGKELTGGWVWCHVNQMCCGPQGNGRKTSRGLRLKLVGESDGFRMWTAPDDFSRDWLFDQERRSGVVMLSSALFPSWCSDTRCKMLTKSSGCAHVVRISWGDTRGTRMLWLSHP